MLQKVEGTLAGWSSTMRTIGIIFTIIGTVAMAAWMITDRIDAVRAEVSDSIDAVRADLSDSIDALRVEISGRMSAVEERMSAVEVRVGAIEVRVGAIEVRVGAVEGSVDDAKESILQTNQILIGMQGQISKSQSTLDEFIRGHILLHEQQADAR